MNDSTGPTEESPEPHLAPPTAANDPSTTYKVEKQRTMKTESVAKVALLVALIGSFLPWARVLFFTINGTDGDGIITAIASGLALILIFVASNRMASNRSASGTLIIATLSAVVAAGVYVYDFINVTSLSDDTSSDFIEISVEPQIGLIIGSVGAVVGALATIGLASRSIKRRTPSV